MDISYKKSTVTTGCLISGSYALSRYPSLKVFVSPLEAIHRTLFIFACFYNVGATTVWAASFLIILFIEGDVLLRSA